jgi:hypothetical protein
MDGAFSFGIERQNRIFRDGHRTRELLAAGAGYRCEIGERIDIEVDCAQPPSYALGAAFQRGGWFWKRLSRTFMPSTKVTEAVLCSG